MRNLEPGPSNSLKNCSKAEMHNAVLNFKKAIQQSGIELSTEALNALSAFDDDSDNDDGDDDDSDDREDGSVTSQSQVVDHHSTHSSHSLHNQTPQNVSAAAHNPAFDDFMLKTSSSDSTMSNILKYGTDFPIDTVMEAKTKASFLRSAQHQNHPLSPQVTLSHFNSTQPQAGNGQGKGANNLNEDRAVVDALNSLKKSPLPFNPHSTSGIQVTVQQSSPYPSHPASPEDTPQWKKVKQEVREDDEGGKNSSEFINGGNGLAPAPQDEGISRQIQGMTLRQAQSPSISGSTPGQHQIYHSAALTTTALNRVHQVLFSEIVLRSDGTFGIDHSLKDVPIECVRFFRYLNETAQRVILLNLITSLQRLNVTTSNFILLNHPKFAQVVANRGSKDGFYNDVGIAMEGGMLPPSGFNRNMRKRNASQAEGGELFSSLDEILIDSAVAVVFLMMSSTQMQISLLMKTLQRCDLSEFNEVVLSIINVNNSNSGSASVGSNGVSGSGVMQQGVSL